MPADPVATPVMADLQRRLEWWTVAGLITAEQAVRIMEQEKAWAVSAAAPAPSTPVTAPRRLSAIVEGLGYIGGILTLVGAVLLIGRYWDDMSAVARLALGVGSAVALLVAGLLVAETEPALIRLRWVLWTLSTAAAALTVGITMADSIDDVRGATVSLAVAGIVAVENGALWRGRVRPIQQALFLVALPVVTGSATSIVLGEDAPMAAIGVVVALTGVGLLVAGITHRTVVPALTEGIGSASVVVGVMMSIDTWRGAGFLTALVAVTALLVLALAPRPVIGRNERLVIGLVAVVGLWQVVPATIVHFAQRAGLATGLVVAAVGVIVLDAGRRRVVAVPLLVTLVGGSAIVGGLAVTAAQSVGFATISGLLVALALIGLGTRPGWAVMSVFGAIGLLVNVPWAISWFFPGEGRAPLLIAVAGLLIIGTAVLLAGQRGRIRDEWDQPASTSGGGVSIATGPRP